MIDNNDNHPIVESEVVETIPETKSHHQDSFSPHPNPSAPFVPINHAQNVNIPAPAIPANDMVKLEAHLPGSIDRILRMSEKEQDFTHDIVQAQHDEQIKTNNRNIEISKEQKVFNFTKLWMGFFIILCLMGLAFYLFSIGLTIGGGLITFATLVLAAVFVLGYFPESIFSIFKRGRSSDESE